MEMALFDLIAVTVERAIENIKLFCVLLRESDTWKLIESFMYNDRHKIPIQAPM